MFKNFSETPEFFGHKNELVPFFGVVEDINDPMMLGRARVRVFGIHPESRIDVPTLSLPWATVMTPTTSASTSGIGTTPQLVEGSWVFGYLLDGEKAQFPMVIGTFPGQHRANAPGYGGAAEVPSGYNTSQMQGESAVSGDTPVQYNNVRDSQPISDDGSFLTRRDEASVNLKNYKLRDFSPRYYGNRSFRFHKATAFAFDKVTTEFGKGKLQINSGWRTFGDSRRHPKGRALDISIRNMSESDVYRLINLCAQMGFSSFGIEFTYLHIDTADHYPGLLYAYPRQGAPTGSSAVFNNRARTGRLRHSEILRALTSAGWKRGRTRAFELTPKSGGGEDEVNKQPFQSSTEEQPENDMKNEGAENAAEIGFKDPTNSYPKQDYRGVSSINQAARGLNDDTGQNVALGKENARTVNFPTAFGKATFGEPQIPFNAQYPYNHVISSRAGHMIEMDSTPRSERMHLYTPSGTYTEIDAQGTQVNKTIGDRVNISNRNDYHGIKGDHHLSVDGEISMRTGGDFNKSVDGNMTMVIKNDNSLQIHGDYLIRVGDDVRIKAANLYIEAENIHLLAKEGLFMRGKNIDMYADEGMKVFAKEGLDIKSEADIKVESDGDMNLKSGGEYRMESAGEAGLTSGGNMFLEAPEVRLAEQGPQPEEAEAAKKANDSNIPGGDIRRAEVRKKPSFPVSEINVPRISDGMRVFGAGTGTKYATGDMNDPTGSFSGFVDRSAPDNRRIPSQTQSIPTNVTAENLSPEAKALLDTIAAEESNGRYNVRAGGATFEGFQDHPRILNRNLNSTAAGRYQFIQGTWDFVRSATNLPDFSPRSQDLAAWYYARSMYGQNLQEALEAGDLVSIKRRLGASDGWEALRKMSQEKFDGLYFGNLKKYKAVDDEESEGDEQDDGGLDTSLQTTSPVEEGQDDRDVTGTQSPEEVKNLLNSAPDRQRDPSLRVEEVPAELLKKAHEAARKFDYPVDLIFQVFSWKGGEPEQIAQEGKRFVDELYNKLGKNPTYAQIFAAHELGVEQAVNLVQAFEDKVKRNEPTTQTILRQKEDGPNVNEVRTEAEVFFRLADRLINPRTLVARAGK